MGATLEELEGEVWDEPAHESHLVTTCHRLRKLPIDQFSTEDLRIMIGQNFGLEHLLPIAMNVLRQQPLAAGDFYEGDLLRAVIFSHYVDKRGDVTLNAELVKICEHAMKQLEAQAVAELEYMDDPAEYGLDEQARCDMLSTALKDLVTSEPYQDFVQFIDSQ